MNERLYSSSWYRVAKLRPQLQGHARIHRHRYRNRVWYVLENRSNGRSYRFPPGVYTFLALMDGGRTVEEIWDVASERLGDGAPTQDQVIQLLCQLHQADLLQSDLPPNVVEALRGHEHRRLRARLRQLASPFFFRVPVFDPDALLRRLAPLFRPLFAKTPFVLWLLVVITAGALACMHWRDLAASSNRVLAPNNLHLYLVQQESQSDIWVARIGGS